MTELIVGIKHVRDEAEIVATSKAEMSVLGIIGTAPDADEDIWPLNTLVYFNTNDSTIVGGLGNNGTLPDAVRGVSGQLGVQQSAARAIGIRVADDADANTVITNIVGDEDAKTGMWAFLEAPQIIGFSPRLMMAPAHTPQHESTGGSVAVTRSAKSGGNTGDGVMTLATPAYGSGRKAGVYEVRCIGGAKAATSAAKAGGNTGNGTVGSLTADTDAVTGAWRVVCQAAITNGGIFPVYRPDGTFDGLAQVGVAYNSAHGVNFTIADGSTDFIVGDEFVITVVDSVPANGGVFSVTAPDDTVLPTATVGVAYSSDIKFTIADGATDFIIGDGFDVTVVVTNAVALANPILAEIPTILDRLRAVMAADGPASGRQAWIDWRETISSNRIIPLASDVIVQASNGDQVVKPSSPRILGIGVRRDNEADGVPVYSWANQAVHGILGPSRPIGFSLVDAANEGQDLIGRNAGIIVRGESGVESAIAEGGFVFWGTDTCSDDPLWQFYHVVRLRDYIELMQVKALRYYLGKFNVTRQTILAVLNTMDTQLSQMKTRGYVLDYRIGFEPDKNSPEELRLGNIQTMFRAEEPPVLRKITISSRRYREALIALVQTIATQINQQIGGQ